ncbi:hypothetical protein PIROE2DRAFT_1894 [Piromyces sp. E2]|nr:hypothetical protein PIROE2DRAFT_1894 [Piromyces sp. E2]|eukprot:OUM69959.1 hypothetical protein PIROE2DRAFT_1894 [Piromyces sp. E2]
MIFIGCACPTALSYCYINIDALGIIDATVTTNNGVCTNFSLTYKILSISLTLEFSCTLLALFTELLSLSKTELML